MGLLDLAGSLMGNLGQGGGLMGVVMTLINENGGLPGFISKLQSGGMGEQVKSWIGTGANLPISPEQIQAILGNDKVQAIASQLGIGQFDAAKGLADLLPTAIDKMTPDGQMPSGGGDLMGMLKGFMG